jgi:hypothetical protein
VLEALEEASRVRPAPGAPLPSPWRTAKASHGRRG